MTGHTASGQTGRDDGGPDLPFFRPGLKSLETSQERANQRSNPEETTNRKMAQRKRVEQKKINRKLRPVVVLKLRPDFDQEEAIIAKFTYQY